MPIISRDLSGQWDLKRMCILRNEVGCFRSSEGFSQATPTSGASPRLILLPFGGIPNSPGSRRMLVVCRGVRK